MPKLNLDPSAIQEYLDHIADDYDRWSNPDAAANEFNRSYRLQEMQNFRKGLTYEIGSKYIKVIMNNAGNRSVHSFIVNSPKGKFPMGSILKAASWKAPAMNFRRGSVLTGDFANVRWTGL